MFLVCPPDRFQILSGESWSKGQSSAAMMKKAREKVLQWWRTQLEPYSNVVQISSSVEDSFNNGLAILALIHKVAPSAVDLDAAVARERSDGFDGRHFNLEMAFELAQKHLKIAPLFSAADMLDENELARPDEKCKYIDGLIIEYLFYVNFIMNSQAY